MIPAFCQSHVHFQPCLIASLDSSIKRSTVKWKNNSFGIFDNLISLVFRDLKIEVEIPQGEYMRVHSTYIHFVDEQNLMLYHHCLHQSLKVVTKFQQPVLEAFSNRLYRLNLKEMKIWVEFETKVKAVTE